jgi:undecaprenyl diphosphate synthase
MKKIPHHIVLCPDGNRRWAKKRALSTLKGHQKGHQNLIKFCKWCDARGVKVLTAFGFSTENWNRSKKEVEYLMKLFENGLVQNMEKYTKTGIKIRVIGQKERLPKSLQKIINKVENLTKNNDKFYLNLAVSYGGRWDILQAFKKILKKKISKQELSEDLVNNELSTKGLPEPDLVIRTGGEKRLSNFLLWQTAYSELIFLDKLWPDFLEKDLDKVLREYSQRQRKFGK